MSTSELERFSTDLRSDASLQAKVTERGSDLSGIVETAQASGYGITLEEVQEQISARGDEVSEHELDSVAGGRGMLVLVIINMPVVITGSRITY